MLRSILCVSQVLYVLLAWVILPITQAEEIIDERFVLTRFTHEGIVDNEFGDRGVIWTAFPPSPDYWEQAHGEAVTIDREGRIVVAGWAAAESGGRSRIALARYLPDGRLDPSFGKNGRVLRESGEEKFSRAFAVAIDRVDGAIAVAGEVGDEPGETRMAAALYLDKGEPASYFGGGLVQASFEDAQISSGRAVATDKWGRIIVAGYVIHQEQGKFALIRYQRDGTPDKDFGDKGTMVTSFSQQYSGVLDARANAVAIDDEGRIVVAGIVRGTLKHPLGDANMGFGLARYSDNGQLDVSFGKNGVIATAFGPGLSAEATALVIERDAILAAGTVTSGSEILFGLASYDENGKPKRRFNNKVALVVPWDHNVSSCAMVVQPNGQIVLGGTVHADPPTFGIARLHADGKLDSDFGIGGRCEYEPVFWSDAKVGGIVLDDKDILIAGYGRVVDRLPERGTIADVRLELDWDPSVLDVPSLIGLCNKFHGRVYDALDGQLSIERFTIVDDHASWDPWIYDWEFEHAPSGPRGILTMDLLESSKLLPVDPPEDDPFSGRPKKPDVFQLSNLCSPFGVTHCDWLMFKLWCAAYTGTALEKAGAPLGHDCVMSFSPTVVDEFCRPLNYNPTTLQGQLRGMSCYEWMVKTLGFPYWESVPTVEIRGPSNPPAPSIVIRGHHILRHAVVERLCEYEYKGGSEKINPGVLEGLILYTPEGKQVNIGMSANSDRHSDKDVGHTNGKLVVEVIDGEKIDYLEVLFKQYHDGHYLSSLKQKEVGFSAMRGDYDHGSYSQEQLKKSRSTYRVEAVVQNVNNIEWQYWKGVRFGSSWPWNGRVGRSITEVEFLIKDAGQEYRLRLRGWEVLLWDY